MMKTSFSLCPLLLLFFSFFSLSIQIVEAETTTGQCNEKLKSLETTIETNIKRADKFGIPLPWMDLALSRVSDYQNIQSKYDKFFSIKRTANVGCNGIPSEILGSYFRTINQNDLNDFLQEDFIQELPQHVQSHLQKLQDNPTSISVSESFSHIEEDGFEVGYLKFDATFDGDTGNFRILLLVPAVTLKLKPGCSFTNEFRNHFTNFSPDLQDLLTINAAENRKFINTLEEYSFVMRLHNENIQLKQKVLQTTIKENIKKAKQLGFTLPWMISAVDLLPSYEKLKSNYLSFLNSPHYYISSLDNSHQCYLQPSELITTYFLTIAKSDYKDFLQEDFVNDLPGEIQQELQLLRKEMVSHKVTNAFARRFSINNQVAYEIGHYYFHVEILFKKIQILLFIPSIKGILSTNCNFSKEFKDDFHNLSGDIQNYLSIKAAENQGFLEATKGKNEQNNLNQLGFEKIITKTGKLFHNPYDDESYLYVYFSTIGSSLFIFCNLISVGGFVLVLSLTTSIFNEIQKVKMTGTAHPCYTMAAISSIGGIIGFVKKGSKPSLIAGLVCGGVYAFSGYLITSNNEQGHDIAAVTSVILAAVMGSRVISTKKFMPAGLVTICAAAVGSYSIYQALNFRGEL